MLNKQKQQQIVCLINCGTPEQDYNFLKHSGGSSHVRKVFETLTSTKSFNLGVVGVRINKPFDGNGDFLTFTQKNLRSFH